MRERKNNVLFNDALNTFYLRLYGVRHMVKDPFLYAPSHIQDNIYHGLCYSSRGGSTGWNEKYTVMILVLIFSRHKYRYLPRAGIIKSCLFNTSQAK